MPNAVKRACSSFGLLGKEFGVGRIGAGIAAFDIVDAEAIEHLGDDLLVVQREVDAVGLRAVAQRGVEQIKAFAAHWGAPGAAGTSAFCIVVLASHSPVAGHGIALLGDVAALLEEIDRVVAGIDRQRSWRRARRQAFPARRSAWRRRPARRRSDAHRACRYIRCPSARQSRPANSAASRSASVRPRASCRTHPRPRPPSPRLPAAPRCNRRRSIPGSRQRRSPPAAAHRLQKRSQRGFGSVCPIVSKAVRHEFQGKQERGNDHRPFDEDVIAPVFWERRFGLRHQAISQCPACRRHPCRP